MATLPPTANPSQQPLNLEDEDGILDEYDQYSLAHPCVAPRTHK
ncbi:nuclear protein 1, isoform CRA_a [Mus musculus]|uniref:Nuclear protein transcription regulator 1 n=1 Tax=Mus musculus TaxID=10090 RepID=A0A0U1RPB6_MOUSE|nr:nuclear protein 1, isoform CRA_a [Mus musculus]